MKKVEEGDDLLSISNPRKSLFVLESNICNQMKMFRRSLDADMIKKIKTISKGI